MKLSLVTILAATAAAQAAAAADLDAAGGASGRGLQGNSGKNNGNGGGNGNGNGGGGGGNPFGGGGGGGNNGNKPNQGGGGNPNKPTQGGGGNPNAGGGGNPNKPNQGGGGGNNGNGGNGGGGNPNAGGGGNRPNTEGGGGCPADAPSCASGGVQMCRVRNARKGIVANSCVQQARQQEMLLARGGKCGCCDFANPLDENGAANIGACPTGECNPSDDCNDGTGSYMCKQKGGSGRFSSVCVPKEQVLRMQGRGAQCGCCGGACPSASCSSSGVAVECSLDDGETSEDGTEETVADGSESSGVGYYMCRALNPKRGRYKTQCVADEETLARQFRGDQCGCCELKGDEWVASANCPAVCTGDPCEKVNDDGTTEAGSFMCMRQGPNTRTMCVVGDETIIQRQLNGQATCGSCS